MTAGDRQPLLRDAARPVTDKSLVSQLARLRKNRRVFFAGAKRQHKKVASAAPKVIVRDITKLRAEVVRDLIDHADTLHLTEAQVAAIMEATGQNAGVRYSAVVKPVSIG